MFDGFIIMRTCVSGDCVELQVTKTHLTVTSSQRMYLSHPMTPGGKQPRGQSWGSAGRRGTSNFCPLLHTHCSTILSCGRWVFQTHSSVAGSQKVKGTGKGDTPVFPPFQGTPGNPASELLLLLRWPSFVTGLPNCSGACEMIIFKLSRLPTPN